MRCKNALFLTLGLVTAIPTILPAVAASATSIRPSWQAFVVLIGILGNAHVGMTGFFFVAEPRYRPILRDNPLRYFWLPSLCMGGALTLFLHSPKGFWLYFLFHYAWLLWHFGRQNFGLYALVTNANRSGAPTSIERAFFSLLPVAAIPKAWTIYPDIGLGPDIIPWLVGVSWAMAFLCGGLLLTILRDLRMRADWQRCAALALSVGFFLPTLLSSDPAVALAFFAHPLQYIVMMLYLAGDRKQGRLLPRFAWLVTTGVALWTAIHFTQGPFAGLSLALAFGVTQIHFLVDAGVWRLALAPQRRIVADSFDFLFTAPRTATPSLNQGNHTAATGQR